MSRIAFVNKMDRIGADFEKVVAAIRDRLGAHPVPIQTPIGREDFFRGVIDLIRMKSIIYDDYSLGAKFTVGDIPSDLVEASRQERERLIEFLSDHDENLMRKCLNEEAFSQEEIVGALRRATLFLKATPVLCGSAFRNKGVQPLLDAVINCLPSPLDTPP